MIFSEANLARQAVDSTIETLYTVPGDTVAVVKDVHICNNADSNCWVSLWLVPNGGSASDENVMFAEWNVPANDFVHWAGYQILDTAGDTIQAQAETSDQITVHVSGAEIE